ncbi:NO-inducible flavohemoprotein [Skermanella rosea]|uniref:NO-inducible flavohemoprotein n=1 Tax=Skermanella rosea TaxID=1817965 RepID=UPI001933DA71|nr:NO-inducible flavohemoprotein [Skermanella rosea]UEM05114.1 NO-inducible flavohemoprotein [Skermanella rosea]
MLSAKTVQVVKATVPALKDKGLDITRRMYQILFRNEEIRDLFNQSHHGETGSQPRSLALAVLAYAENIDRLEVLGPMVERIAQKHVALSILPEHYPHVGTALLQAIRDVLGPAATDEIMEAWAEAYGFLADVLIGREQVIYGEQAAQPGGWTGYRDFVIDRVTAESDIIKSFYLRPADGGALMDFKPGQYLTFRFDLPGHGSVVRNYSLSCAPGADHYRISVKREPAPAGNPAAGPGLVSGFLHDHGAPGTVLKVAAPAGDFFLDDPVAERPVVLLSGGVGLTPMVSMLDSIVAAGAGRPTLFVHGTRSGAHHAMKDHVRTVAATHPGVKAVTFYEQPRPQDVPGRDFDHAGVITPEWLRRAVPHTDADFYFCGPKPFMRLLARTLTDLGVDRDRLHYEFFGPADELYA